MANLNINDQGYQGYKPFFADQFQAQFGNPYDSMTQNQTSSPTVGTGSSYGSAQTARFQAPAPQPPTPPASLPAVPSAPMPSPWAAMQTTQQKPAQKNTVNPATASYVKDAISQAQYGPFQESLY